MDKLALMVDFPKLAPPARFEITSPRTVAYNCIAWAAGETQRKWWPDKMGVAYWPRGVPAGVGSGFGTKARAFSPPPEGSGT